MSKAIENDLIKHKVIFLKYIMTAKELAWNSKRRSQQTQLHGTFLEAPTTLTWISHIHASNGMQVSREQKAPTEPEQEIQINGQPVNNFER